MKQDVEAPMLNISDNMRDAVMTLSTQLETLRDQLSSVNQTHDQTLNSSEVVRTRLAHETESLRLEAEGAFANIDAVSTKLADQITGLNEIGLGAAQQIATVQQDFTQQAQNLSQVSTQLGEHVQTIADSIDRQNNQLELLGSAARDYGTAIADQVKANADILNETAKDPKAIEALGRAVSKEFERYAKLNNNVPEEALSAVAESDSPAKLVDTVAGHLNVR